MISLDDLFRTGEIEFSVTARKLDCTKADAQHIMSQCTTYLTVTGTGLEQYLSTTENLNELTDFLFQCRNESPARIHVYIDIQNINAHYPQSREGGLINMFGELLIDTTGWLPAMNQFERDWNFALCAADACYNHTDWPQSEQEFDEQCALHATSIIIGTPAQLSRYQQYGVKYPHYQKEITAMLKVFTA